MAGRITKLRATAAVINGTPAVRTTRVRGTAVVHLALPVVRVSQLRATAVVTLTGGSFDCSPGGSLW